MQEKSKELGMKLCKNCIKEVVQGVQKESSKELAKIVCMKVATC